MLAGYQQMQPLHGDLYDSCGGVGDNENGPRLTDLQDKTSLEVGGSSEDISYRTAPLLT